MAAKNRVFTVRRVFTVPSVNAALALALTATTAHGGTTPEERCEAGKNDAAGRYAACVGKAEKGYVVSDDATKYGAALLKCAEKYAGTWGKLEQKAVDAATTCPSTGDASAVQHFVDACAETVAVAVGGGGLPLDVVACNDGLDACGDDLATCGADLATCEAELSMSNGDLADCESRRGTLRTGYTAPFIAGDDGNVQAGAVRNFTDNGDGTISDNVTGLMWEKLSDDGSIHDADNTYSWSDAFAVKIAGLNASGFAGHSDWRLPNRFELESILNLGATFGAVYPPFSTGCVAACTVTSCSCTRVMAMWSSTTLQGFPTLAWSVHFYGGDTEGPAKTASLGVRAVRAGF